MSGSSFVSSSSHHISILASPKGRCLQCSHCKLSFQFPDGVQYGAIAKRFEFNLCGSFESRFLILKHKGKIPAMASCAKCQCKFFTPSSTFERDSVGAEQYLESKFDLHRCEGPQR
jgi:hypothetical protein